MHPAAERAPRPRPGEAGSGGASAGHVRAGGRLGWQPRACGPGEKATVPLATVRTRLPPPRRRRPCPAPARAARRRCSRREAPGPRAPRPGRPEALGAGSQLNSAEPRSTSFVTGAAFSCHTERRQGHPANTWQADWEPHAWGGAALQGQGAAGAKAPEGTIQLRGPVPGSPRRLGCPSTTGACDTKPRGASGCSSHRASGTTPFRSPTAQARHRHTWPQRTSMTVREAFMNSGSSLAADK